VAAAAAARMEAGAVFRTRLSMVKGTATTAVVNVTYAMLI